MGWDFEVGKLYSRHADIHDRYGGQEQSGIVTPRGVPGIFLFTGSGGERVGYADRFLEDGSFRYTGEGQVGPMAMAKGNRAVRDHAIDGKDLLVFKKGGSGQPVRYLGLFVCTGWDREEQPDRNGDPRPAIVFNLTPADAVHDRLAASDDAPAGGASLDELRKRALEAAAEPPSGPGKTSSNFYKRSKAVRDYVLARANGICEACGAAAPFLRACGTPYLEPHHIRRVSDGGPDHPRFVAGVCPNCHRRAHSGADRVEYNLKLLSRISEREDA